LKRIHPAAKIRPQGKRYKLATGLWYKPDFTSMINGVEHAWEIKGPHAFRGGFENIKFAAHEWPEIKWRLMWRENGQWKYQDILP